MLTFNLPIYGANLYKNLINETTGNRYFNWKTTILLESSEIGKYFEKESYCCLSSISGSKLLFNGFFNFTV